MYGTHSERTHVASTRTHESADEFVSLAITSITQYLRANPRAADTVSGIAQWWLAPLGVSVPLDSLRLALNYLVDSGVLETRVLPSSELLWFARSATPAAAAPDPGDDGNPP
jgi:hypothetical protein